MPQLSFAELIERDVPLTAEEAVALALAADAARGTRAGEPSFGPIEEILLSSSGDVTFASRVANYDEDEGAWLTLLVCRLLRLDELEDRARCRGRVPGGLLVLVARMRGQIDLPPLASDALRASLKRFSPGPDPSSLLAAVFWRAARMRSRQSEGAGSGASVHSRASAERRRRGPSASELRRWLRQTERELFTVQQRRTPVMIGAVHRATDIARRPVSAVAIACVAAALGLWVQAVNRPEPSPQSDENLVVLDRPTARMPGPTLLSSEADPRVRPGVASLVIAETRPAAGREPLKSAKVHRSAGFARTKMAQAPSNRTTTVRTVRLVNLPRASWTVVQSTSSVAPIHRVADSRPNRKAATSKPSDRDGRRTP